MASIIYALCIRSEANENVYISPHKKIISFCRVNRLRSLCQASYIVLCIRSEANENVYMSQGAWQNDSVTQMNQIKDSRMLKKKYTFVFPTDFDYQYTNTGIHSSNSL